MAASNIRRLPDSIGDMPQTYANMNAYKADWNVEGMLGAYWEIDAETYDHFLNILPPRYCAGGFRMSERLTDDIAATFLQVRGRYWCAYTNLRDLKPADMIAAIAKAEAAQ